MIFCSKPGNTKPDEGGSWWQSWGKSLVDTVKEKVTNLSNAIYPLN